MQRSEGILLLFYKQANLLLLQFMVLISLQVQGHVAGSQSLDFHMAVLRLWVQTCLCSLTSSGIHELFYRSDLSRKGERSMQWNVVSGDSACNL